MARLSTTKLRSAELKDAIASALRRQSGLTVIFHAAVAERMGLGPADHKCLDLLLQLGPMAAGELAQKTGLTSGAITGVVDRLVQAGFALRTADPKDRRRVVVQPVKDKIFVEFEPVFGGIARATSALLDRYSVEQLEVVLDFLTRAHALVEKQTAALRET